MIEALRKVDPVLDGVGGHPMAAGFTLKTSRVAEFQKAFHELSKKLVTPKLLERTLLVDSEIEFSDITDNLMDSLNLFHPFGVGNPHPVFATSDVSVRDVRTVGADGKHLKLFVEKDGASFSAIGFSMGSKIKDLGNAHLVSIAYTPESSTWNGATRTELKLKDIVTKDT